MIRKHDRRVRQWCGAVTFATVGLLTLTGCGGGGKETSPISESALPSTVPGSFDPCHDISKEILTSHHLNPAPRTTDDDFGGEQHYKGCQYSAPDNEVADYGVVTDIQVTNMTIDYFTTHYPHAERLSIGNREAATAGILNNSSCRLLISVKGGGLLFDTSVSKNDACKVLTSLAEAIIPTLPSGT